MALPTLAELKAYLGGATGFSEARWTDPALQSVLDAETAAQGRVCRLPADPEDYPDDLAAALLRRCQRAIEMRSQPLAVLQDNDEFGSSTVVLPGRDPEVRRLEAPFRRLVVG
ncbi:hypothetical protein [Kribbella jiaozuonensis]|uniref:Uncharacterized protein n=1 Tax=Kribbella jiaozuonensis TaxID=2575441 RepID=A0A4U3M3K1_9ACTN|nr:hypothetical protein [Kribbella jiaozuonensis]TKK79201.1 hypothetical protein FDA38_12285 [Kribbella jiaozuonensis]TKK83271.1 hypothetical protein FDA38_11240 [Kribbella jiaozuonensis]